MKHLRLFESLDYEITELSEDEYYRICDDNEELEDMTSKEIETLFDMFSKKTQLKNLSYATSVEFSKLIKSKISDKYHKRVITTSDDFPEFVCMFEDRNILFIKEIKDEWFLIRLYTGNGFGKQWKVDQFEGLMTLLKSLISKIPDIDYEMLELDDLIERRIESISKEWRTYTKEEKIRLYNKIKK